MTTKLTRAELLAMTKRYVRVGDTSQEEKPAVAAVPMPTPTKGGVVMPPPVTPPAPTPRANDQWTTIKAGLFVAILGGVILFALGYNLKPIARPIEVVTVPALSLPADTPSAAGPRRTYAPQMTPDARARTHWLLMCHSGMYWYATRQQAVQAQWDLCGGGGIIHEPLGRNP
jgi:hypothetical protein